jgi:hypothetical protein
MTPKHVKTSRFGCKCLALLCHPGLGQRGIFLLQVIEPQMVNYLSLQPTHFCNLSHENAYKQVFFILNILALAPVVADYIHQYAFLKG